MRGYLPTLCEDGCDVFDLRFKRKSEFAAGTTFLRTLCRSPAELSN